MSNVLSKQVIVKSSQPYHVKAFDSAMKNGTINMDRAMQRKKDRWSIENKSKLIHSIVTGFGMLPLHANKITELDEKGKPSNTYYVIDGKQRGTTICEFVNDGFALNFDDEIYGSFYDENGQLYELQGKKFSELDADVQIMILSFSINVVAYDNLTEEQEVELMDRLNNGEPMSFFEKFRIKNHKIIRSVHELVRSEFVTNLSFTPKQIIASEDEQTVINILSILYAKDFGLKPDFQKWGIWEFAKEFKELSNEKKEHLLKVFNYTHQTFNLLDEKIRKKILKKSHIPGIVLMTVKAFDEKISCESLSKWFYKFFIEEHPERKKGGDDYRNSVKNTAGKKEKIEKRILILNDSYESYFHPEHKTMFINYEDEEE